MSAVGSFRGLLLHHFVAERVVRDPMVWAGLADPDNIPVIRTVNLNGWAMLEHPVGHLKSQPMLKAVGKIARNLAVGERQKSKGQVYRPAVIDIPRVPTVQRTRNTVHHARMQIRCRLALCGEVDHNPTKPTTRSRVTLQVVGRTQVRQVLDTGVE